MTHVSPLPVLLVDDDPQVLQSASIVLRTSGAAHVITVADSGAVMPLLAEQEVGVMVLDLTMPHLAGHTLLEQVAGDYPDIPVILMTATNDLETAVQCMRIGASGYLVKPVEESRLVSSVKRALEIRTLRAEVLSLKDHLLTETPHQREAFAEIITQSKAMFAIFRYVEAVAPSPQPVLITGETGTGKELVARALHRLSARPAALVAVNMAGLDDTMFSDTLFGHTRGAFTGADQARDSVITSTAEGTLFLDEIGDLSVASQVKLLRLTATEPLEESPPALTAWFPEQLPTLKEVEDVLLTEAMRRADENQGVAAVLLGISRQALNKRLCRRQSPGRAAEPGE